MISGPAIYAISMLRCLALLLLLVALAGSGCSTSDHPPLGSRWQLVAIESSKLPALVLPADLKVTLTFRENGSTSFSAGCTGGVGSSYDFGEPNDTVGVVRPISCQNGRQDAWDLEVAFAQFSWEAESHELTEDELIVYSPTDTWRFRRLPDEGSETAPLR